MTDPEAVAAALTRLVTGTAPTAPPPRPDRDRWPRPAASPETVVAEAEGALSRLRTAAAFVEDGGYQRLSRAVSAAEQSGEHAVEERGQAVLTELERFRAVANGRKQSSETGGRRGDDQFHRARTTLLTGGSIGSE